MTNIDAETTNPIFEAPGPGFWELETTHHGLRPLSHLLRDAYARAFEAGAAAMVERYGLPIERIEAALVQGCFYVRPRAVGEGSKPSPPPPKPIMQLIARVHPELRRRNRTAKAAWADRRWRAEVAGWFEHERDEVMARNCELQGIDPSALSVEDLLAHLSECLDHLEEGMRRNLDTHGGDLIPVGDLLAHGERWGIESAAMAGLLRGSSPATVETRDLLRPVADALGRSLSAPGSLEEVRALSEEASAAVDEWMEHHAWRLLTSDDVDRPTLAELPELQLRAVLAAARPDPGRADPAPVRARVPVEDRDLFDQLLTEARYGNQQREDIRGLCWNWPGGLVRRAMLEAGRRLVSAGRLHEVEHAAELAPDELDKLLQDGIGPTANELAARATTRDAVEALPPPRTLGEPEAPPPLDAFPAAMARSTMALIAGLEADATAPQVEPLRGTGVGDHVYRGRVCQAGDAGEAMGRLQPGDVLIAPFTGPSFNSLLPIVGALVVEEGGPLCHAAIVAREFGIPAVIGAREATTLQPGTMVEVDPVEGVVRPL